MDKFESVADSRYFFLAICRIFPPNMHFVSFFTSSPPSPSFIDYTNATELEELISKIEGALHELHLDDRGASLYFMPLFFPPPLSLFLPALFLYLPACLKVSIFSSFFLSLFPSRFPSFFQNMEFLPPSLPPSLSPLFLPPVGMYFDFVRFSYCFAHHTGVSSFEPGVYHLAQLTFQESSYALQLYVSNLPPLKNVSQNPSWEKGTEDHYTVSMLSMSDFNSDFALFTSQPHMTWLNDANPDIGDSPLHSWFGVHEFLLMHPSRGENESGGASTTANHAGPKKPFLIRKKLQQGESDLLVSCLNIALANSGCMLPAYVPTGDTARQAYIGTASGGGVACEFTTDIANLRNVPQVYRHLEGVVDLFKSKLRPLPRPSVTSSDPTTWTSLSWIWRHEITHRAARMVDHSMLLWDPPPTEVSEEFSYNVELPIVPTRLPKWRVPLVQDRVVLDQKPLQTTLALSEMERLSGVGCGSNSLPLWGPIVDPLDSMSLVVHWPSLREGSFAENSVYTSLDPLGDDLKRDCAWRLQVDWTECSDLTDTGEGMRGERLATPLTLKIHSLLAALVQAHSAPIGSMIEDLYKTETRRLSVVASEIGILDGEGEAKTDFPALSSQTATFMSSKDSGNGNTFHLAADEIDALLDSLLLEGKKGGTPRTPVALHNVPSETASGELFGREAPKAGAGIGGSSAVYPLLKTSPAGQTLSLLTLSLSEQISLKSICAVWMRFTHRLRNYWDTSLPVPRSPSYWWWRNNEDYGPSKEAVAGESGKKVTKRSRSPGFLFLYRFYVNCLCALDIFGGELGVAESRVLYFYF
jgi:hypothetical protein